MPSAVDTCHVCGNRRDIVDNLETGTDSRLCRKCARLHVPSTLRHMPWLIIVRGRVTYGAWLRETALNAVSACGTARGGRILPQPAVLRSAELLKLES